MIMLTPNRTSIYVCKGQPTSHYLDAFTSRQLDMLMQLEEADPVDVSGHNS